MGKALRGHVCRVAAIAYATWHMSSGEQAPYVEAIKCVLPRSTNLELGIHADWRNGARAAEVSKF
jgi:hypothetical protein